ARRALSGRTALLVLDGTEEADDLSAVQAVAAGCGLLLTSRRKQDAVAQRQDLERLPGHEAVKLLQAWAQPQTIQTTIAEAICELVGGLPLAVRLVGRYLNETGESAADYLAWLQETPLEALDQGQRRHESVAMLLERSLVQVSDQARQVLSVTGILALAPFNRELVAAGLAVELKALRRLLGELVSYGLLLRREQGYEVTHALIRTYARTRLIPDGEITARLLRYFTDEVEAQSKQGGAGFRHLDSVRPHLIASLKSGLQHQFWEPLQSLAFVCGHADGYFALQGHWIQWAEIVEAGLQAARQLGQRQQEVAFMAYRGQIYHAHQNYEQAIAQYERALALSREIGFQRGEGNTLADLGGAYRRLGQPEQAIVYHEQALQLKRHLGDRKAEGNSMGSLGNTYHDLRDFDMALHYFEAALAISRELGDRRGESVRLGNIGVVYHDRGQLGEAIKFTEEALAVAKNAGDRHSEATWLANLGQFYEETGQWAEARLYYQRAVELFDAFGTPDAEKVRRYLLELEAARPKSAKEGIQ
ncbi:MAG TPA: tetratricopeptide repeat protein, partial [Anaerolineae bacterium]|nr:tetratricopeptide repeat protein [Anaerolineae bacterium]